MWVPGRFIMGGLALVVALLLVRAWRSGRIQDEIWSYDANDNPIMYALMFAGHIVMVAFCVACAAGYTPSEIINLVGLGWLKPFLPDTSA